MLIFIFCRDAEIPLNVSAASFKGALLSDSIVDDNFNSVAAGKNVYFKDDDQFIVLKLGFFNLITLYLTLIGSVIYVLLAGYGLSSFPMSYLNFFLNRPKLVK